MLLLLLDLKKIYLFNSVGGAGSDISAVDDGKEEEIEDEKERADDERDAQSRMVRQEEEAGSIRHHSGSSAG